MTQEEVSSCTVSWFYATYMRESAKAIWFTQPRGKSTLNPAYPSSVCPVALIASAEINAIVTHEFWLYRVSFWEHLCSDLPTLTGKVFSIFCRYIWAFRPLLKLDDVFITKRSLTQVILASIYVEVGWPDMIAWHRVAHLTYRASASVAVTCWSI